MIRPLPALLAAALALGACARETGLPEDPWSALAPAGAGSGARPVSAAAALVHLPAGAGAVVAVGEERGRDRHRQRIVWPGDRSVAGETFAEVEIGIGARRPAKPTDEAIRRAAAAALPAAPGEARFGENALGPYGVVLDGTGAAARCLYAWQTVEPDRERSLLATLGPEPARASIRWRLCRSGLGEAGLLALLDGAGPGAGEPPVAPTAAAPTPMRPVRVERRPPAPAAVAASPVAPRPADRVAAAPAIPMP